MLFNLKTISQIHLIHKPIDFRKGVFGLNYLLYEQGYEQYDIGEIFIFFSKNRKSLKILYYSKTGFELWHKKLNNFNRYKIPLDLNALSTTKNPLYPLQYLTKTTFLFFAKMASFPIKLIFSNNQ